MFYVLQSSQKDQGSAITLRSDVSDAAVDSGYLRDGLADDDIDFVDDAILNIAPQNPIERQLLNGDMIGLALMSGAILWTAMGAIA